jgi:hypothetical protein
MYEPTGLYVLYMHVQNAINSLTVPSSKTSAHRHPNLDDTNPVLEFQTECFLRGIAMFHSPRKEGKNAPIPKFPSHNTSDFMHTAVLLPLLFALSAYRDNVHPCPRASILCLYPTTPSFVHFLSASDSS